MAVAPHSPWLFLLSEAASTPSGLSLRDERRQAKEQQRKEAF